MSDEIIVTDSNIIDATSLDNSLMPEPIRFDQGGYLGIPIIYQMYILNIRDETHAMQIIPALNINGDKVILHDGENFILGCDQELEIDGKIIIAKVTHEDMV